MEAMMTEQYYKRESELIRAIADYAGVPAVIDMLASVSKHDADLCKFLLSTADAVRRITGETGKRVNPTLAIQDDGGIPFVE
jgi:hypothetical protein